MIGNANSSARARSLPTWVIDLRACDRATAELDVTPAGELALQAGGVGLDSQV